MQVMSTTQRKSAVSPTSSVRFSGGETSGRPHTFTEQRSVRKEEEESQYLFKEVLPEVHLDFCKGQMPKKCKLFTLFALSMIIDNVCYQFLVCTLGTAS